MYPAPADKIPLVAAGLWIKHHARLHTVVALVVFMIGLSATTYYWHNLREGVDADLQNATTHQIAAIQGAMTTRIQLYENFLRGSAGLFAIHSGLTQADWEKYHAPYNVAQNYPDIEAIAVARYLTPDTVPAFLQRRADQGDTAFAIAPAGDRTAYAPVTFSVAYGKDPGDRVGYDEYADPIRKTAIDNAITTNSLTMSGALQTVNNTGQHDTAFIIYLPVYQNGLPTATSQDRRTSLLGLVYVSVDSTKFMNAVLAANQNADIGLTVADADAVSSRSTLYQSADFSSLAKRSGSISRDDTLNLFGHSWSMHYAVSSNLLPARERGEPEQALWRGIVTCIFFAGLVWYLITDRERTYARQKREEVQTAKDDLLSLASHQLRTPATVVKQYVGMLIQGYGGKLTPQQITMLNHAYTSNERQLEIINQLLYVARLDAGRITLRTQKVDIPTLVREVTGDQCEVITSRKQRMEFRLPRHLAVEVDPQYMRMVLENLLSNAIKYTQPKGTITVEVRREHAQLRLVVRDTGVGIPATAQEAIFEKFTRVENDLSTSVNGSGVGLYLTREIIELHGGTIEVQSVPEQGSAFIVHIPLKQQLSLVLGEHA